MNDENSINGFSVKYQGVQNNLIYEERDVNKTPNRFYYNAADKVGSQSSTPAHHQSQQSNQFKNSTNLQQPVPQFQQAPKPTGPSSVTASTTGTTTLSDVKNRLLMMQKNKEELEEKLRRINRMPTSQY